jgi:hypothetical protein
MSEGIYTLREGLVGLIVHYFSRNTYKSTPFDIIIVYDIPENLNYMALFVSITIILMVCICCSVACYKCSQILLKRRLRERMNSNNPAVQNEIQHINVNVERNNVDELKEKNKKIINNMFEDKLKPTRYSDQINEFGIVTCSICLDNFEGSDVCVLTCKHIFHHNCIKDWLLKDSLKPKCPVCNDIILENQYNDNVISYFPVNSHVVVVRGVGNN